MNSMEESIQESEIDEQNIPPKEESSSNTIIYKIASVILILLIIYFTYLIYSKL